MQAATVADGGKGGDRGGKINIAGAQRKVLVPAGEHVVDVHVGDHAVPRPQVRGVRPLAHAFHVADVHGEPQRRRPAEAIKQRGSEGERVDHHPGLRLEGDDDAGLCRVRHDLGEPVSKPVSECLQGRPVATDARPERHAPRTEVRRHVDRPPREVDAARPGRRIG